MGSFKIANFGDFLNKENHEKSGNLKNRFSKLPSFFFFFPGSQRFFRKQARPAGGLLGSKNHSHMAASTTNRISYAATMHIESLLPPRGSLPYCHDRHRIFRAFVTESLLLSYYIWSLTCRRNSHHRPLHDRVRRHDRAFSAPTKKSLLAPSLKSHS